MLIALHALQEIQESELVRKLSIDVEIIRAHWITAYVRCYDWLLSSPSSDGLDNVWYVNNVVWSIVEAQHPYTFASSVVDLAILASGITYREMPVKKHSSRHLNLEVSLNRLWVEDQNRLARPHSGPLRRRYRDAYDTYR